MYMKDQIKTSSSITKLSNEDKCRGYVPLNMTLLTTILQEVQGTLSFLGRALDTVEILARTTSFSVSSLRVELTLSDQFGTIGAMIYKKSDKESHILKDFQYEEMGWVIALGSIRKIGDEYLFILQGLKNIRDYSEILAFRAKVIWNIFIFKKKIHDPIAITPVSQQKLNISESNSFGYFTPQKLQDGLRMVTGQKLGAGQSLQDISNEVINVELDNEEMKTLPKISQEIIKSLHTQMKEYELGGVPKAKIIEIMASRLSVVELE